MGVVVKRVAIGERGVRLLGFVDLVCVWVYFCCCGGGFSC
jgi:hypothetical protein